MLIEHEGKRPSVSESAYVAPNAVVCGDVTIGEEASILFGAVLTAEGGSIEIGRRCVVMENALVRGRAGHPTRVGDHTLVGPHAHVNGASLDQEVFLATGSSVFPGARIGRGAEVRINGVVHVNTVLAPEAIVPIAWIAVGDPAELFAPDRHEEIWAIQEQLNFPGTAFGLDRDQATMERITERYADLFARHRADRAL
jgi:carbonic anhydrase/acetyltransferase-like protein (isoleucine patch superfamily)